MPKPVVLVVVLLAIFASHRPALAACNIVNGKGYGDCSGVQINNDPPASIIVAGPKHESGMIDGATIRSGGHLTLSGMSQGLIAVQPGGSLHVQGTAAGVQCDGGTVTIDGMVSWLSASGCAVEISGMLGQLSGSAEVQLNEGAIFQGSPIPETRRFSTDPANGQ